MQNIKEMIEMVSAIDPTKPADGIPAAKADLRSNLQAAKTELDHGGFAEGLMPSNYGPPASSRVKDHLAAIDAALGMGVGTFTSLSDVPSDYAGHGSKFVKVKSDESGLDFVVSGGATNADAVSFAPPWSGVATRTIESRLMEVASVKDFGAVGDGLANDTAKVQAALSSGAQIVFLPQGTYRVSSTLIVPPGVRLFGAGMDATVIRASGSSLGSVVQCLGPALTQLPDLSSTANRGNCFVSLASSPGTLVNYRDVLVLHRPGDLWNTERTSHERGEYQLIAQASGSEVHFVGTLYDTYGSGSTTDVYRMQAAEFNLSDLTIDANGSSEGLNLERINGGEIRNVRVTGAGDRAIELTRCYDVLFDHCIVAQTTVAAGDRYGIVISNSQKIRGMHCTVSAVRHAVTLGGVGGGVIPVNREVFFDRCNIGVAHDLGSDAGQAFQAVADHHGNVENCGYRFCTIYGAIALSGHDCHYVGNHILASNQSATPHCIHISEPKSLSHLIMGNIFECGTGTGIRAVSAGDLESSLSTAGTFAIANNIFRGTSTAYFIDIDNGGSTADKNLLIQGNSFEGGRTNILRLTQNAGGNFNDVLMIGNRLPTNAVVTPTAVTNFRQCDQVGGHLVFGGLPTANPGGTGRLWNSSGAVRIT